MKKILRLLCKLQGHPLITEDVFACRCGNNKYHIVKESRCYCGKCENTLISKRAYTKAELLKEEWFISD